MNEGLVRGDEGGGLQNTYRKINLSIFPLSTFNLYSYFNPSVFQTNFVARKQHKDSNNNSNREVTSLIIQFHTSLSRWLVFMFCGFPFTSNYPLNIIDDVIIRDNSYIKTENYIGAGGKGSYERRQRETPYGFPFAPHFQQKYITNPQLVTSTMCHTEKIQNPDISMEHIYFQFFLC